jgi:hemerythrin superfamily protein
MLHQRARPARDRCACGAHGKFAAGTKGLRQARRLHVKTATAHAGNLNDSLKKGVTAMNIIEMLKQDHQEAAAMMDQIEAAGEGDPSVMTMFNQLKQALTLHTQIEEQIFYPALQSNDQTEDQISESFEEHQEVKDMLAEMSGLQAGNDEFMGMMSDLRDAVEHHVEEEEDELFPKAQEILGDSRLQEMGQQMMQMKQGRSATATQKRR